MYIIYNIQYIIIIIIIWLCTLGKKRRISECLVGWKKVETPICIVAVDARSSSDKIPIVDILYYYNIVFITN